MLSLLKPGLNKFDISISPISFKSENNTDNNYSSFYIDIVENEKIFNVI